MTEPRWSGMDSGKAPSNKYPTGRTCADERCTTTLSRYNAGKYCSVHEKNPREKLAPPPAKEQ